MTSIYKVVEGLEKKSERMETIEGGSVVASYAVSWTAASVNPAIGNGTLNGRYFLSGRFCDVVVNLQMGSTTTFGSGVYSFSLPFASAAAGLNRLGVADLIDASTGLRLFYGITLVAGASVITYFLTGAAVAQLSPTVPWTWASGDVLRFQFSYEIA
jgi:hypothetical protein